jgi:predicted Rossmann-fold nucleotide-binding protein
MSEMTKTEKQNVAEADKLPFNPLRQELYTPQELYAGFSPGDQESYVKVPDARIYAHYVATGRGQPESPYVGMMQSLHDHSIYRTMEGFIKGRELAGIMGGHKLQRSSEEYRKVAHLALKLAKKGFVVCSGGGPGAMEASHLGASASGLGEVGLDKIIERLARTPALPKGLMNLISDAGTYHKSFGREVHGWLAPAWEAARELFRGKPAESLAVPTWHYGHEPFSPFPTHVAKLFQNSIREEGLLAIANRGVVFAPGTAGTVQEIFQDACQNYYRSFGAFTPMVLFVKRYWEEEYPVLPVLKKLFSKEEYDRFVLVTDGVEEAAEFIEKTKPN